MQTKENLIRAAQARTKNEVQAKDQTSKPDHWQRERDREKADPENQVLQTAIAHGKLRVTAFFASLKDRKHPDHDKNWSKWKGEYAMDSKKAEADIAEESCRQQNAKKFERRDPTYENMVYSKYKPLDSNVTVESLAAWDNFKSAMREKWDSKGTAGDAKFIDQVAEKYSLSPNNHIQSLSEFKPKD